MNMLILNGYFRYGCLFIYRLNIFTDAVSVIIFAVLLYF